MPAVKRKIMTNPPLLLIGYRLMKTSKSAVGLKIVSCSNRCIIFQCCVLLGVDSVYIDFVIEKKLQDKLGFFSIRNSALVEV